MVSDIETVDVILRTKNSEDYLTECLRTVFDEIPVRKIILVDNGSTDKTIEIASKFDNIEVFVKPELNLGQLTKFGFSMAQTEWVVVIDSDMILRKGWYQTMSSYRAQADAIEACEVNHYVLEKNVNCNEFAYGRFGQVLIKREPVLGLDLNVSFSEDVIISYEFRRKGLKWKKLPDHLGDHYPKIEGSVHKRTGTIFGLTAIHVPKNIQIEEGRRARKYGMFTTKQLILRVLIIPLNDALRGFRRNFWFTLAYLKII